ncbi:anthranilate synthase component I family protein [Pontibacter sp. MBLB2868]|uniref:anthranilate synthase component I family protein n=1 Tax=Pontibacter sp. MBLB2868 TaxID=3451555 RepID=UPI003F7568C5
MHTSEICLSKIPVSGNEFRLKALNWAAQYPLVAYYQNNAIPYPHHGFQHLLAVSAGKPLPLNQQESFESLRNEIRKQDSLLCGYLSYDLKNQVEKLSSHNSDAIGFPLISFFRPEIHIYINSSSINITVTGTTTQSVINAILATPLPETEKLPTLKVKQRVSPEQYIGNVEKIRKHILEGNVYELNYCIEFYAESVEISPLPLYLALNEASPTPFSGFLKLEDKYLLCASPERFLKKSGDKLISQPIKGTIRRGTTPEEDAALQDQLRHDEKELAENMMIVDLVRNDLSRACATGTVQVEEMFGIYGFRQVSQMISTITGNLKPDQDLVDALQCTFPMGSMTGAPKISAMQLIEELEDTRRGLYSGAFGYITENQDCDFNVVIRSLQYNASQKYLSFMVGSAITYDSEPKQEYAECLLKAKAILQVLNACMTSK